MHQHPRKPERRILLGLLLFNGLSALFGGSVLVAAPDGSILGLPLALLSRTPFSDFLIPGAILFTVLGIGSCIGYVLVYRRHAWAARWVQVVGMGTLIWIVTQVIMIRGIDVLHLIYAATGVALVAFATKGTKAAAPSRSTHVVDPSP